MKGTVIGAGNMGSAFVSQLVRAGHQVSVTARDAARAAQVAAARPGVSAVAPAGAARGADVVLVATAYADTASALRTADVRSMSRRRQRGSGPEAVLRSEPRSVS